MVRNRFGVFHPQQESGCMKETGHESLERVGIMGLGAIGRVLASALDAGSLPGLKLQAVCVRDPESARAWMADHLRQAVRISAAAALSDDCDVVVECAPAHLLVGMAEPALKKGRKLVVMSAGALLDAPQLVELARQNGGQIIVPTGALLGLDAVAAAAEGKINSVTMVTRKPIAGLAGAPFLSEHDISITDIREPLCIFRGNAREAAKGFPANVNVAVALSLAGVGPEDTTVEIWADPTVLRNTHTIRVDSDSASFTMTIENIPSENPKTGRITAKSLIACLRKMHAPLRVGT